MAYFFLSIQNDVWFYLFLLFFGVAVVLVVVYFKDLKKFHASNSLPYKKLYNLLAYNTLEVIWTTDPNLLINYISPSVKRLSGYLPDEILGKKLTDFVAESSKEMVDNIFDNLHTSLNDRTHIGVQNNERFEFYLQKKNGGKIWVETTVTSNNLEDGTFKGLIGVSFDISFRKRAENSLRKSDIALRQAKADKQKFLSVLAHELKNPFTKITGYTELLTQSESNLSESQKMDFLNQIHQQANLGYQMMENLMVWSKINSGKLKNQPQKIKLEQLIRETIFLFQQSINNKRLKVFFENNPNLYLYIDAYIASFILKNILHNAIKFTKPEGNITIEASSDDKFTIVTIADTGVGMLSSQLHNIWELSESTSSNGTAGERGSGLGLVVTRDLLNLSRGFITLNSQLNNGTQVRIFIPADNHQR